jgi:ribosomal-protein-alanine N-acetyltransferase
MFITKKDLMTVDAAEAIWSFSNQAYTTGSPWTVAQFAADICQPNSEYLVLTENDQWVGYIAYHFVLDEAEVQHVVVAKERQQSGVGSQLIQKLKQHLVEKAITQVFLEVRASNLAAQKLYQKNGFFAAAVRKNYYQKPQENALVMCAKLRK